MSARRSHLSVPGANPRFLARAATAPADTVFFDLEDSVLPRDKERARAMVVDALAADFGERVVGVRINAVDTEWCLDDARAMYAGAAGRFDLLVVPKVESVRHVHYLEVLLGQLELSHPVARPVGLDLQVESARGLAAVEEMARASDRVRALVLGPGDLLASLRVPELMVGGQPAGYPGDFWHAIQVRLLVAARAAGVLAIDGPYARVRDLDGLRESSRRVAALGYDGRWALTPDQATVINQAFTPDQADFERAVAILDAHAAADTGAVMLGDEMIDEATRKMAEVMVERGRAAGLNR